MEADYFVGLAQQSLWVLALASAPILIPILVVGVLLGMVQAATSINEQTLSFLPRLVVTLGVLIFAGKWMLTQLVDFTVQIFHQAAALVG